MSKAKREKRSSGQQKAADTILTNRDLEKNLLSISEIMAVVPFCGF